MNLTELISILVKTSIILVVFSFGLRANWSDATCVLRHPTKLLRSFFAMNIVMLLLAVAMAKLFSLYPPVKLALIVLALSPIPPILPKRQIKAGDNETYAYGLLVGMSLLAMVAVPLLVPLTGRLFHLEMHVNPAIIAKILLITILAPLATGILVHSWKPIFAKSAAKWILVVGNILLAICIVFILFGMRHTLLSLIGGGTLLSFITFAVVGLMVGHLHGGPVPEHRSSLALATASRHPAVALAIANATFPGEKRVLAAVLLYLIVSILVSIPYLNWRKHQQEARESHHWRHGTA